MDLASIVGLVVCFVLVIFGITFDDGGLAFGNLTAFIDVPSAIITFGGAFCCVLAMCGDFKDFINLITEFYQTGKIKDKEWDI